MHRLFRLARLSCWLSVAAFCAASDGAAQAPRRLQLNPPDGSLSEEFISITGIRELSDGRVLVSDLRARRLVIADFRTATAAQVGRVGSGPGEYDRPGALYALKGDSTLLVAGSNRRWLILSGAQMARTISADDPSIVASRGFIHGADSLGFVYAQQSIAGRTDSFAAAFSSDIQPQIRIRRSDGSAATIATLRGEPFRLVKANDVMGEVTRIRRPPFAVAEQSIAFPDGWYAIARLEPFRVDWVAPDGRVVRGAPLFADSPMTERDKEEFRRRFPDRAGRPSVYDFDAFPARVPAFQDASLIGSQDGRLLIRRTPTATNPETRYDIVNRRSELTGSLYVPTNERVVGFGARSVFIAYRDTDDIERLRRHPWF